MTYEEWKSIKSITGTDNERVIRNFELSNPNRKQRWKQIANSAYT